MAADCAEASDGRCRASARALAPSKPAAFAAAACAPLGQTVTSPRPHDGDERAAAAAPVGYLSPTELTPAHALVVCELLAALATRAPRATESDDDGGWARALLRAACDALGLRSRTARAAVLARAAPAPGALPLADTPTLTDSLALARRSFEAGGRAARAAIVRPLLALLASGAADARTLLVLRAAASTLGVHWEIAARAADEWARDGAARLCAARAAARPRCARADADADADAEGEGEGEGEGTLMVVRAHLGAAARLDSLSFAREGVRHFRLARMSDTIGAELVIGVSGFAPPHRAGADADAVGLGAPWRALALELGAHEVWALSWGGEGVGKISAALHGGGVRAVDGGGDARGVLGALGGALGVHGPALLPSTWTACAAQAKAAGRLLAEQLSRHALGRRPVTLVGFSLGGRVVFHTLECLADAGALDAVLDVALLGAAVTSKPERWERVRPAVAGRLVNGFSPNDSFLRAHHRLMHVASPPPAGSVPVRCASVENVDVGDALPDHRALASASAILLRRLGVPHT